MAFELFGDVVLTTGLPDECLMAGDVGTVVERHVVRRPHQRTTTS